MRRINKFLCLALTVMMAVSCVSVTAFADNVSSGFSDVASDQLYSNAVSTLNLMGIIKGYEENGGFAFKPDQNVTRAEFTAMLMRTLKLGEVGNPSAADLPFSDVSDSNSDISWAIPNINTAYGMGVINGYEDGTFRPSDNVAYEEAVKMIVCVLGYGANIDTSSTPWYAGFIATAGQIGVTKTASRIGQNEKPASRACIAQLLYDSLEIKLVENESRTNKTILSDYLGYTKCTGVIYSNGITSLSAPDVNIREDEVQIYAKEEDSSSYELHTYSTTDETLKDYLGYEVEFYYQSDGSDIRTLIFCVLKDTEPLTINAANVETSGTTATQIKYYENLDDDREKTANLESDNVVIYNGKLYGASEGSSRFDTDMIPEVGEMKLIDSDNNGRYDVVDITAYDIYYVSSKTSSTSEIVDNVIRVVDNPNDRTLKLDINADRNLSIVNKNGNEVTYSSIAVGNIICLAKSSDNGSDVIRKAVVLTDKVTGSVTARGNDKVTIAGKEYRYSNAAPWMKGGTTLTEPQTQDSGTYYFDINGDVVAYSKNATSDNSKYGYIMGVGNRKDAFDDSIILRVMTESSGSQSIATYKNTRVNGEICSTGADVRAALEATADSEVGDVQQLIKYTTRTSDGETVFDRIYTAEAVEQGEDVVTDKLTVFAGIKADAPVTYNSSSRVLTSGNLRVNVGSVKTVISVPENGDYDDYRKMSYSSAFKNGKSYNIRAFDVSKTNAASVIVLYGADNSEAVDSSSPVYVLEELSEAENSAEGGTRMNKIKGMKSSASSPKGTFDEWVSTDSEAAVVEVLEKGDIFRAGLDKDGYTKIESRHILYDMDGSNKFGITTDPANEDMEDAEYTLILGSVVARDDSMVSIATKELSTDSEYDIADAISFYVSDFDRAQVLVYDNTGRNLEINKEDYKAAIEGLAAFADGANPSKVLIYMSEGNIKLLCVLPQ